jgi:hypothetical protein
MDKFSHYLRPRVKSAAVPLVIVVLAAALSCGLIYRALELHAAGLESSRRIDALRAAQVKKPVAEPTKAQADEQKQWSALRAERDFSWTPIFKAIENVGNADIELLEFQPDKLNRRLLLRGEAKGEEELIAFVEALASQPALHHVHLTHRKNRKRDRLQTISFELRATLAL